MNDIERAKHAQKLLSDEILIGAFQRVEEDLIKSWRDTSQDDAAGRERLFHAVQIVGKVRSCLNAIVTNGQLEQRHLDDIARRTQSYERYNPEHGHRLW